MTSRAELLARVREVLGRAAGAPVGPAPAMDEGVARTVGVGEDLAAIFAKRAAEAGMVVHRSSAGGLAAKIEEVLVRLGARTVAMAEGMGAEVERGIDRAGARRVEWRDGAGFEPFYDVDVGITGVEAAVAETGSLVCAATSGSARGLSLVPPVHVAVVRRGELVADLIDWYKRSGPMSSSTVLITGPSKTADIEGVLITGVHGPREVHVVLELAER